MPNLENLKLSVVLNSQLYLFNYPRFSKLLAARSREALCTMKEIKLVDYVV